MIGELLEIGKIVNTHALKGEVKIQPWCDDAAIFFELKKVYINSEEYRILNARIHKNFVIVKFDGIDSIEKAQNLKNTIVKVEKKALGELPEGVYYICDLIGCRVETSFGIKLGIVEDVIKTGSNDVYVLNETKSGKPILIPVLKETILSVDIENKLIKVELLKGLVDENEI